MHPAEAVLSLCFALLGKKALEENVCGLFGRKVSPVMNVFLTQTCKYLWKYEHTRDHNMRSLMSLYQKKPLCVSLIKPPPAAISLAIVKIIKCMLIVFALFKVDL